MLYLDASALVKLIVTEPESAALTRWLADQPNLVRTSSTLIRVQVPRAALRADPAALPDSYRVIRQIVEVELSDEVLSRAAGVRPPVLRAIDAIHLASALTLRRELTAFVAYDKRLLAAARDAGLPVASPA